MEKWYSRLADVPGVEFDGGVGVDRTRLPDHDAKPRVVRHTWEGKHETYLMWKTKEGETSAAPASQWETKPRAGETEARTALRQCHEALELPGTLSNYHFIIQSAHDELWKHRRREAWVIAEVERLCWLDLRLIQSHPKTVQDELSGQNEDRYFHVTAFHRLVMLYELEGYVQEALEVARLAARFGQTAHDLERLEEKLSALEQEETPDAA